MMPILLCGVRDLYSLLQTLCFILGEQQVNRQGILELNNWEAVLDQCGSFIPVMILLELKCKFLKTQSLRTPSLHCYCHTIEPGCQTPMLIGKRAASWALHIQGCLQKLTMPINFMTSWTPSARVHMDSFNKR